jgi:DNA-binding transcriptional MerR regulator
LPIALSSSTESAVTPSFRVSRPPKSRHLSALPAANHGDSSRMTRGQVAKRLGISVSSVRRYEGERLHPSVDDNDVRWFEEKEVTALAAHLANQSGAKGTRGAKGLVARPSEERTAGEIAALVFERFEQRQSLAEIVIGLRVEPDVVAQLFEQYCRGLTERQLRKREPNVPLVDDIPKVHRSELERRLAALPNDQTTRISVGRWRGSYPAGEDRADHAWLVELGGFVVGGPCAIDEVTRRYGSGSYRVTAYSFEPAGVRWEVLIEDLR